MVLKTPNENILWHINSFPYAGTNQALQIRRGAEGNILKHSSSPDLCNCGRFQPFWVSWENKLIEMGTGHDRLHPLLTHNDEENGHEVTAVSLSTYTGTVGWFYMPEHYCESFFSMCVNPIDFLLYHFFQWRSWMECTLTDSLFFNFTYSWCCLLPHRKRIGLPTPA